MFGGRSRAVVPGLTLAAATIAVSTAAVSTAAVSAPALADTAVPVTLAPAYAPAGADLEVDAAAGLAQVTSVQFAGSAAPVGRTDNPPSDTSLHVTVPADATSGVLTLDYSNGSSAVTDQSFSVQQPTQASIAVSRRPVVFPRPTVVTATLTAMGQPVAGLSAQLQSRPVAGGSWHRVQPAATTDARGSVHWRLTPHMTRLYRVTFAAVPDYLGTQTSPVRIGVVPRVRAHAPALAPILTPLHLSGRVQPAPAAGSRVVLTSWAGGRWEPVARARTAAHGRFAFPLSFSATGPHRYRVLRPADAGHLAGASPVLRVKAVQRSLHSGLAGPDVRALQRRLARLRYDVGPVNGTFGYDTLHAVIAFEKVQGLPRDGVVGVAVFRRLDRPRVPRLRHPADAASAGVEVDLAHQVLYYAVHGRIVRILDASTGGGYTYTDPDGSVHQAITPTGHFSVVYKRDGWVHAPLGDLYRPAYFNNAGYAIHGETEVPSYPASHGCVRVTVPAMDRLVNLLPIGISVWIY